jgi:ATP-dependent RNA helicase DDX24/MAK5
MQLPGESFKGKDLICFEEISDYSLLTDERLKNKLKRKSSLSHDQPADDAKLKNKKLKKIKKQKTSKKTALADSSVKKIEKEKPDVSLKKKDTQSLVKPPPSNAPKSKQKKRKDLREKRKRKNLRLIEAGKKVARPVKKSKSQSSNSTSKISLHVKQTEQHLEETLDENDFLTKMSAWSSMTLPKSLLRGLYDKGFYEPMPIQKLVIPEAIKNKSNIIGTAQTGSGKTLAFGLPILTHLIDSYDSSLIAGQETNESSDKSSEVEGEAVGDAKNLASLNGAGPQALILTPTRELAIQIKDHLQICSKYQNLKIAVVVGGISLLKQERHLKKKPEIVVATPGRLVQLIEEGNEYLNNMNKIRYLVIDEADRMIEKGHFGEMQKILTLVNSVEKFKNKRQNYLFSATLITKFSGQFEDLNNLTDEVDEKIRKKVEAKVLKEQKATLSSLVDRIQMVKEPIVFDLTTKAVTADNLTEAKIYCSTTEKDMYLYYFVCKYAGRTLVFANSIDCVRRLTNLFRLLKREPLHLHANMEQKQRLKNLEKFNAEENSLLIASDVASRGLDIPGVKHVIHYQVPRSAEIYVHRSGRTARSTSEGLSVMLIQPEEINLYRKIIKTFKKEKDLKDYPIDLDYFDEARTRVNLARKVDQIAHAIEKDKLNTNWYEKHAKMLDVELDDETIKENYVDNSESRKNKRDLNKYKHELDKQLKKMIFPKNTSRSYLRQESFNRIVSMNSMSLILVIFMIFKNKNK